MKRVATVARTVVEQLTVDQLCEELQVARSTFYQWRQVGKAPRCVRLPNGAIRVRRDDLDSWLASLADAA
ncbi:helix-turn-helix domain-containing protein [Pseudonocardia sp. KRD-184]|uniref:Helix-turn-helix domain-containing protein n=1 Tax=Pseudonocardia oceani TaxID=2792013 RepID=A0ABS6U7X1_9PSEU|nr:MULTISPECIES: helix-turn-helix domain-containing protein [Pseudonocardia]MBW0090626.1 helix-turn-helix domain-containing protein [Pseudonocardia oceani]MBW0097746.1 helix-turn-helix domain-containing protein [Pseudonocardia oceani]MBW0110317.1 helix-turn-helix domain-containing protein [Pseudonocardia oceani]MBW0120855.1 helix-turn-helix domain-containing protein [Pseudonocardia oceani]MBW0128066.1 helix-turn-helix domain-containing protein [Pseudonocardia oceani]